jgi:nucleoid-associated protein YgaU
MATYKIKSGDNFKKIAQHFYKNGNLWPNIQEANPEVDPNNLQPGTTINVPDSPDPNKQDTGSSTQ